MLHVRLPRTFFFFFFNDTATTEIYTLSLHDALPISIALSLMLGAAVLMASIAYSFQHYFEHQDRKSTRLNSSHSQISYAVFCLKKKKKDKTANTADAGQGSGRARAVRPTVAHPPMHT